MATTDVTICNNALIKIGASRISALSDLSEKARILQEQYNKIRRDLLYAHPWNFAIKRDTVAADATPPLFEWDNRFALPSDCLRVLSTDQDPGEWHVEGRFIVANSSTLNISYIKDEADASTFTPGFAEVLSLKIAVDICYALTQSTTLLDGLMKQYERKLATVRSFDAQESLGDRIYADSWLNSRS